MSRVNVGIDPALLCPKHLIAEHREIKRLPNALKKRLLKNHPMDDIPRRFRLGTGHVKFFFDKMGYLYLRYKLLHAECLRRGYKVTDFSSAWDDIPTEYMNNWSPSYQDVSIVGERIAQRLLEMEHQ
jgi:hypothetical protein